MEKLGASISRLIDELLRIRQNPMAGTGSSSIGDIKLNPDRLKTLKNSLRQNEELLEPFFEYVVAYYLRKDNVITRIYSVLLIDEIFRRSHRFRECVIENFQVS